jgi:hypothetical protein
LCCGQIYFINDGNNFQSAFNGQIRIRKRLRFNALCGIDNQQRAFAGLLERETS